MIRSIIFDWKRTLYNPDKRILIRESLALLRFVEGKNISVFLVGKGGEGMDREVKRSKVGKFFLKIRFRKGEKDETWFKDLMTKNPQETLFVGDRVRSELVVGNKLGATTIWVKQGKFASEEPETQKRKPDYIVRSLKECQVLLEDLLRS